MLRIRFDQLCKERGPDAVPAMVRFHGEGEFRCGLHFASMLSCRYAQPNCAEHLIVLLGVIGDKAGVACAAPTLHVVSKLRPSHDVSRRCSLAFSCLQALIQRLPENWFIRSCERPNHIIHSIKIRAFTSWTPSIIQYTLAVTSGALNLRLCSLGGHQHRTQGVERRQV